MEVLIGTTNPSKVTRFAGLLSGTGIRLLTPKDLEIQYEPEECGSDPLENAILKAKFYGQYFDRVLCNDSGLYIVGMPPSDPRQPGLHARSPLGKRLDDEEMITHYSALINSLGGKRLCYYWDGIVVNNRGAIHGYMEDEASASENAFYMVGAVHPARRPGWPLDSLSIAVGDSAYFVEHGNPLSQDAPDPIFRDERRRKLLDFLLDSLELRAR